MRFTKRHDFSKSSAPKLFSTIPTNLGTTLATLCAGQLSPKKKRITWNIMEHKSHNTLRNKIMSFDVASTVDLKGVMLKEHMTCSISSVSSEPDPSSSNALKTRCTSERSYEVYASKQWVALRGHGEGAINANQIQSNVSKYQQDSAGAKMHAWSACTPHNLRC